jgi:hypothetical protein
MALSSLTKPALSIKVISTKLSSVVSDDAAVAAFFPPFDFEDLLLSALAV